MEIIAKANEKLVSSGILKTRSLAVDFSYKAKKCTMRVQARRRVASSIQCLEADDTKISTANCKNKQKSCVRTRFRETQCEQLKSQQTQACTR